MLAITPEQEAQVGLVLVETGEMAILLLRVEMEQMVVEAAVVVLAVLLPLAQPRQEATAATA